MTRFGVMKHLKVLEEAGLVTTKRRGREKLHFLNPVPIRLVHDRWVSKYAEPWAAALSELKHDTRGGAAMNARTSSSRRTGDDVFEIYIKTTPERLWEAITDPEMRQKYSFGVGIESDWTAGLGATRSARPGGIDDRRAARTSRSTRRGGSCRASGALERGREGRRHLAGDLGDRAGRATPAGCASPTTSCARAPTASSTAAGR